MNPDRIVDINDISVVLFNFGCGSCDPIDALLQTDGIIDVNDINFILLRLGDVCAQ